MKHLERVCIDMSGMHLLPIYYTTTHHKQRLKKPRKMSKSMEATLREPEKILKKMGVSSNPIVRERTPLKLDGPSNQLPEKNIKDMDWSPCVKKNTPSLSGDYIIGQAYNKGNLQVLSKSDSADDSTGKRR